MTQKRPQNCRNQLQADGKPYPKSGCAVCKTGGMTGCPYERGDTVDSAAAVPALRELLWEARHNGLIYWQPNTERGHERKADMLARIDAALSASAAGHASLAQAGETVGAIPEGWKLVPAQASRAWAYALANYRQGQRDNPRCESPGEYEIKLCQEMISGMLTASPPPPAPVGVDADTANLVVAAREAFDTFTLPDEEARALDKALEPFSSRVRYENEPDDDDDALSQPPVSAPVGVKVKELEWSWEPPYSVARVPTGGHYTVELHDAGVDIDGGFLFRRNEAITTDAAKAICQADYERRILSALTSTPKGVDAVEVAAALNADQIARDTYFELLHVAGFSAARINEILDENKEPLKNVRRGVRAALKAAGITDTSKTVLSDD